MIALQAVKKWLLASGTDAKGSDAPSPSGIIADIEKIKPSVSEGW